MRLVVFYKNHWLSPHAPCRFLNSKNMLFTSVEEYRKIHRYSPQSMVRGTYLKFMMPAMRNKIVMEPHEDIKFVYISDLEQDIGWSDEQNKLGKLLDSIRKKHLCKYLNFSGKF